MDRFIEPALGTRIQVDLGFPSRDGDYDVRFLYVRPIGSHLAVTPPRDTAVVSKGGSTCS